VLSPRRRSNATPAFFSECNFRLPRTVPLSLYSSSPVRLLLRSSFTVFRFPRPFSPQPCQRKPSFTFPPSRFSFPRPGYSVKIRVDELLCFSPSRALFFLANFFVIPFPFHTNNVPTLFFFCAGFFFPVRPFLFIDRSSCSDFSF